jgi:ubiquinol-cytochrome c reductase iron-sulfur subunit
MDQRRIYKTGVITGVVVGSIFVSYIFFASLRPSSAARSDATITIDISGMRAGEMREYSKSAIAPIMVLRRSQEDIKRLAELEDKLRDPRSEESKQPDYAKNQYRSIKPEYFVAYAYEPRLGIRVTYYDELLPSEWYEEKEWYGGFHENYDGALFDKAGRVYKKYGHWEEMNIPIPEHRYETESKITVYFLGIKN